MLPSGVGFFRRPAKALELPGRETDPTFEDTPEVAAVAEPDLGNDPLDGPVGRAEQHARPVDAQPVDVVGERLAERVSKRATEVVGVERESVGDPGGAQARLGEVVRDERRRSHRERASHSRVGGGRPFEQDLGQHQLQVAACRRRRRDGPGLLILEQMLEERAEPIGAGDGLQPFSNRLKDVSKINWSHFWWAVVVVLVGTVLGGWFGYEQIVAPTDAQADRFVRDAVTIGIFILGCIVAALTTGKERADSVAAIGRDFDKLLQAWTENAERKEP